MLKMRSTGYYVGERTVPSDVTFHGHKLQRGLVAVDPTVIPLGTRLYVDGYGYAYADDTGSAIKGLRIDLAVKDKYEEARYNRYNVAVYLLERKKTW
jgi:3D (Asp-Asp-Asp) domain-containing protein